MEEEWKAINNPTLIGFEVSNMGRVRRRLVRPSRTTGLNYTYMTPFQINTGYMGYKLQCNNKTFHYLVHRLVAEHFIPNPENKPEVDHIINDRKNNTVNNLRWATRTENRAHTIRDGVTWCKRDEKWKAVCGGKWLGRHDDRDEAIQLYRREHAEMYKEFSPWYIKPA